MYYQIQVELDMLVKVRDQVKDIIGIFSMPNKKGLKINDVLGLGHYLIKVKDLLWK